MGNAASEICLEANAFMLEAQKISENGCLVAKAARLYLQASEIDIYLAAPYLGLAVIAYASGDQKQAVGLLMRAQSLEPYNLEGAKLLRQFKKQAPEAPLKKSKITALNTPDLSQSISFETAPHKASPPKRIRCTLSLQQAAEQDSEQVMLLQKSLQAIGLALESNGVFDKSTFKAVQKYQYKLKMPVTGIADKRLAQHLNRILDKLDQDPEYFKTSPKTAVENTAESAEPLTEESPTKLGSDLGSANLKDKLSSGAEVQLLQETLDALGFDVDINWQFDAKTSRAIRSIQSQNKLPLTGWVDQKTRAFLNPLIQVAIRQKEELEALLTKVQTYWESQALQAQGFWKDVLFSALKKCFQKCEQATGELFEALDFPEKPLITQTIACKGQLGTISQGELISRVQRLFLEQGIDLKQTGIFDLQSVVALRHFLQSEQLPLSDTIGPQLWPEFNRRLEQVYAKERIRETLILCFREWCQFRQTDYFQSIQDAIEQSIFPLLEQQELPPLTQNLGPPGRYGKLSEGLEVAVLQQILNQLGYACDQSSQFDRSTQLALRQFQTEHKLPLTGMVAEKSRELLNANLKLHISTKLIKRPADCLIGGK